MIDFKQQQDDLNNYIKDNFPKFLKEHKIEEPFYTNEYLDFDKIKKNFALFLEFDNSTFPTTGNFIDDCSDTEKLLVNVFLVFRNDTPENLNTKMLNATSAFWNMIRLEQFDAITTHINKIEFFKYVEGNMNLMSSKITIELTKEV